jgi:hypothetical protein
MHLPLANAAEQNHVVQSPQHRAAVNPEWLMVLVLQVITDQQTYLTTAAMESPAQIAADNPEWLLWGMSLAGDCLAAEMPAAPTLRIITPPITTRIRSIQTAAFINRAIIHPQIHRM